MYLFSEFSLPLFLLLLTLWTLGGWGLLARFDLSPRERLFLGLGLGLTLATLLANFLGRFLPTSAAFWLSAVLPALIFLFPRKNLAASLPENLNFSTFSALLLFFLLVFLSTLTGRGLGIFDDYQNLPQVSSLALGDLPPHFAFSPALLWSYHYFLPLVAAQFTRLTNAAPWVAMDLARGLTLALTLIYAAFLAHRITGSKIAAALAAAFLYLAGGARWILLLLPAAWLDRVSAAVTLIGSGAASGESLEAALYQPWKIQGQPPLPFPFLYGSGLDPSLVLSHAGYGVSALMLIFLILLLAGRGRGWQEMPVLMILLAALALANEVTFALFYAGLLFAAFFWMIARRSWRLPASLWRWLPALMGGGLLALIQGGVLTGAALNLWGRLTGAPAAEALYKVTFALRLPTVLSAHLGALPLFDPAAWFAILAETGLTIFALPWALRHAWRLAQEERWLEAAWLASIVPSLLTVFLEYTGNAGPTALSRITAHFLLVLKLYAVPLLWLWLKNRHEEAQIVALVWGAAACLSGIALFGAQLTAAPHPIYAEFLTSLDAQMYQKHWGALAVDAWVFDPNPPRGTTTLGLHTLSGTNYGPPDDPTFLALEAAPLPAAFAAAGYRYLYLDEEFWQKYAESLNAPCVQTLDDLQTFSKQGKLIQRRVLLDVGGCR
ncbi:MAG: hypothetical protein CO094_08205 [Anaerolineae bacterium CG_4_9_14_3_um_filter_57_17]|nr:hypothetical protein [bacterium]OIO87417.1 MAG: hypothetical protein AUK01_00310 [Anaerolineae bacterium CG2_30_57_67]PJB66056.1 MAG: hypothetical protein CO094_08205 [Anaerolineae bacterium CG_4_9_14_3_um_filter_57_17]